jgi:hypothetical protein
MAARRLKHPRGRKDNMTTPLPLGGGKADTEVLRPVLERGKVPEQTAFVKPRAFLQECDRGLVETLRLYGKTFTHVLAVDKCIESNKLSTVEEVVVFVKNFVSFWIPFAIGDDLPPGMTDAPYPLMSTNARSFFRNTFGSGGRSGRRIIRLAGLINYSKRLFPAVPREYVEKKLSDYARDLTREDPAHFPFQQALKDAIEKEIDALGSTFVADYTRSQSG